MTVLTVDFEMAIWSVLLFLCYFYSTMRFKENQYLTCEFGVKLHLKTNIALTASRFVQYSDEILSNLMKLISENFMSVTRKRHSRKI